MQNPGFSSQRKAPRRKFTKTVGCLLAGEYQLVKAHEIGEGGMAIELPVQVAKGTHLVATFKVGESHLTTAKAEVKFQAENGMTYLTGVMFLNLDFSMRRHIRNYVAEKSSQELKLKR